MSTSAPLRSPRRSASQPRFARPRASRPPSPVARASAMKESSSGRTCAYRSAQSSENARKRSRTRTTASLLDRVASPPARSARSARSVPTSTGSLVRTETKARRPAAQEAREIAACPLAQRVTSKGHRGCGRRVDHPGEDSLSLELERELRVAGIERQRGTIENLDRLREALGAEKRERQHPGRLGGGGDVRRDVHGPLQVLGPAGEPGERLGHSELQQQSRLVIRRRWLVERAAQEDGCRLGSALPPRRARRLDESIDDPTVGGRLALQQVLGDALDSRPVARPAVGRLVGGPAHAQRWRAPNRHRCGRSGG